MAADTQTKWTYAEWKRAFQLHWSWRLLLFLLGAGLLLVSALVYLDPPARTTSEHFPGDFKSNKVTVAETEPSALVIGGFGAGLALIAWAINGLRIRSFEGMGVKVDVPAIEQPDALANTPPDVGPLEPPNPPLAAPPVAPPPTPTPSPTATPTPTPTATIQAPPSSPLMKGVRFFGTPPPPYFPGQVGVDLTHTFMLRSSWHALKVLKACEVSKVAGAAPFSLREVASRTDMSYDYALGYFIAAYSADVIHGVADPASGMARVMNTKPTLTEKIDEVIAGNLRVMPELEPQKQRELAALNEYLGAILLGAKRTGKLPGYDAVSAFKQLDEQREGARQQAIEAATAESQAKQRADALSLEMAPLVKSAADLVVVVVERAARDGLVQIAEKTGAVVLPSPLLRTSSEALKNPAEEGAHPARSLRIRFVDGTNWVLYAMPGAVKSPKLLDPSDQPFDVMPLVRLCEESTRASIVLGTLGFDPTTKELKFTHNGRGSGRPVVDTDIEAIVATKKGEEAVVAATMVLLREEAFRAGQRK